MLLNFYLKTILQVCKELRFMQDQLESFELYPWQEVRAKIAWLYLVTGLDIWLGFF